MSVDTHLLPLAGAIYRQEGGGNACRTWDPHLSTPQTLIGRRFGWAGAFRCTSGANPNKSRLPLGVTVCSYRFRRSFTTRRAAVLHAHLGIPIFGPHGHYLAVAWAWEGALGRYSECRSPSTPIFRVTPDQHSAPSPPPALPRRRPLTPSPPTLLQLGASAFIYPPCAASSFFWLLVEGASRPRRTSPPPPSPFG